MIPISDLTHDHFTPLSASLTLPDLKTLPLDSFLCTEDWT